MSFKVLVADDSLTIQKVIGITLANSGYELVECLNETDLMIKVKESQYDLILLDFNLSESKSGYDLAKAIRDYQNKSPVLVLLGTFDSIDESKFVENGITDKIVKPFESSKFIKKCKLLIEESLVTEEVSQPAVFEEKKTEKSFEENNLDAWTLEAPRAEAVNDQQIESNTFINSAPSSDPLANEIHGWGFGGAELTAGPSIIGNDDFPNITMPEKITFSDESVANDIISKLQSASNFEIGEEDFSDDTTDPHITIANDKREIIEAVEENISPDSFWAVDDVQPIQSEEIFQLDTNALFQDEPTEDLTEKVREFKSQEQLSSTQPIIDEQRIIDELKSHLTPLIEKWVKEACGETVEKVAWDVIPDLAENLIRKEIKELADSIKH